MRKLRKVTVGFVVQEYVQLGDTLVCVGQDFVCGDEVTWESPDGEVVSTPEDHVYQPFEMEQPEVPWSSAEEEEQQRIKEEELRRAEEEQRRVKERGYTVDPGNWFE